MSIFGWFKKPTTQELIIVPEGKLPSNKIKTRKEGGVEKGMWVTTSNDRTGVLYIVDGDMGEVHLTDAAGLTISVEQYPLSTLRIAKATDIPYDRISHLSRNQLRDFGYGEL